MRLNRATAVLTFVSCAVTLGSTGFDWYDNYFGGDRSGALKGWQLRNGRALTALGLLLLSATIANLGALRRIQNWIPLTTALGVLSLAMTVAFAARIVIETGESLDYQYPLLAASVALKAAYLTVLFAVVGSLTSWWRYCVNRFGMPTY